jgi:uncharacterized protein (DUF342 family)
LQQFKYKIDPESLPQTSSGITNEEEIKPYMQVLRKTHEELGHKLEATRFQEKKKKKLAEKEKNPNFIKNKLFNLRKKHSLKKKIRKMRNEGIFPQPKGNMNYKKKIGLLRKGSIKIWD